MSLDLLKERLGSSVSTTKKEEIENKEKIIQNLEEETNDLSGQVSNLETEKNNILQELNKARHFEEGAFSIKEKDYINELQSKDVVIKQVKQKAGLLYEKIDKQEERLSYRNKLINNSLVTIKESKEYIGKLNKKLNISKRKKKELKESFKSEMNKTYNEYIFKMESYETELTDKNDIINKKKKQLIETVKKLKEMNNTVKNLKSKNNKDKKIINELNNKLEESNNSFILENDTFKNKLNQKDKSISKLKNEIENLSEKVSVLSETAREKSILEQKLKEAESFQEIVKNYENKHQLVPQKKSQIFNTDNLVYKLREIIKQKQGQKELTWKQWLDIPESQYLLELNKYVAEKIFNDNNQVAVQYLLREKRRTSDTHKKRLHKQYIPTAAENFRNSYLVLDWDFSTQMSSSTDGSGNDLFRGVESIEQNLDFANHAKNNYSGSWGIRDLMTDSNTITPDNRIVTDSDGIQNLLLASNDTADATGGQIIMNNTDANDGTGLDAASALPGYLEPSNDALPVQTQNDLIDALLDVMSEDIQKTYVLTFMIPETTVQGNPNTGSVNYNNRYSYMIKNDAISVYTEGGDGEELQWRFGTGITVSQTSTYLKPMIEYSKNGSFSGGNGSVTSPTAMTHGTKHVIFFGFDRTSNNKLFIQLHGGSKDEETIIYDPDNGTPAYTTGGSAKFQMLSHGDAGEYFSSTHIRPEWHVYDFRVYDKYFDDDDMGTVYSELKDKYNLPDV